MDGPRSIQPLRPRSERSTWGARIRSLPEVFWIIVVFIMVVGGIMRGFFTPTEAGAVGTFAVLLLAIVKRDMTFKIYVKSVKEGLRTAIMILMLIAGSTVLGHFVAVTNIPQVTADWVADSSHQPLLDYDSYLYCLRNWGLLH